MNIRKPVVAGSFYYFDRENLKLQLRELFSGVKTKPLYRIVVSPHAGYMYSGKTAAYAISSLEKSRDYIIIGPNHTGLGEIFSVMSSGAWETPLGICKINSRIAEKLRDCNFLREEPLAHLEEHSIEVQLPLLQYLNNDFTFVPISILNISYSDGFMKECEILGKTIAKIMKQEKVNLVISSDFSHYLPREVAEKRDSAVIKSIKTLSLKKFFETLQRENSSICGFGPIAVAMSVAKEMNWKMKVIKKSDSGDVTKNTSNVVAYYAIGFK